MTQLSTSSSIITGDFTRLAADYAKYRPDYSPEVLDRLLAHTGVQAGDCVADVGAGTGIFSKMLLERGLNLHCVEPNEAMRFEGERFTRGYKASWKAGSGEATGLSENSVKWVTMASSFHWVETAAGLAEFKRILQKGGHFTALWNPRDIQGHALHEGIEKRIRDFLPDLKRRSSGMGEFASRLPELLTASGQFGELSFIEAKHVLHVTPERYMGAWRSVNEIQAKAGPKMFEAILEAIAFEIKGLQLIEVPYRTRAWTVRVV